MMSLMSTTRSSSSVLQSSNRFVSSPGSWLELEVLCTNFKMANSEIGYYRSSENGWMAHLGSMRLRFDCPPWKRWKRKLGIIFKMATTYFANYKNPVFISDLSLSLDFGMLPRPRLWECWCSGGRFHTFAWAWWGRETLRGCNGHQCHRSPHTGHRRQLTAVIQNDKFTFSIINHLLTGTIWAWWSRHLGCPGQLVYYDRENFFEIFLTTWRISWPDLRHVLKICLSLGGDLHGYDLDYLLGGFS